MENKEKKLLKALKEISKGEGAYNLDPLKHASNTIDNMKSIALNAIKDFETPEETIEDPDQIEAFDGDTT